MSAAVYSASRLFPFLEHDFHRPQRGVVRGEGTVEEQRMPERILRLSPLVSVEVDAAHGECRDSCHAS